MSKPPFVMSPLNLLTTARYDACLSAGGHAPSGKTITRDSGRLGMAVYQVCARCDVPYGQSVTAYNGKVLLEG